MNPTKGGWLIAVTLITAMLLSVVHLPESWPEWLGWLRPNWVVLVLFFWVIEVPHRVGLIAVWGAGLFVDVLYADPIGLNGLILAGVTYVGWRFFERLRMYSVFQQCGILLLLVTAAELLRLLVVGIGSERQWGWHALLSPLATMVVWPLMFLFLLRLRTGARVE